SGHAWGRCDRPAGAGFQPGGCSWARPGLSNSGNDLFEFGRAGCFPLKISRSQQLIEKIVNIDPNLLVSSQSLVKMKLQHGPATISRGQIENRIILAIGPAALERINPHHPRLRGGGE